VVDFVDFDNFDELVRTIRWCRGLTHIWGL